MRISRSRRALAATLVVAGLTAPPALAKPLHPLAAAPASRHSLQTPDAQDAATPRARVRSLQTPDAQDAASAPRPVPPSGEADGFDWTAAALGAGGGIVVLVSAAGALVVARRRGVAVN